MVDLVKKSILFGLGTFELSKERLNEFIKKLQEEDKITPDEGKKVAEKVWKDVGEKSKELSQDFKDAVKKALSELGVATKEDIENLRKDLKK